MALPRLALRGFAHGILACDFLYVDIVLNPGPRRAADPTTLRRWSDIAELTRPVPRCR